MDFSGDMDELEKVVEKIKEIIFGFVDDFEVLEMNFDLLKKKMFG